MPRNTCTSPSIFPRTRPALVRTTGAPAAERASGDTASRPSDAANNVRRRSSNISGRDIVECPVLNQRGPGRDILALDAAQAKAVATSVECMKLAAHACLAQCVVHHQGILQR